MGRAENPIHQFVRNKSPAFFGQPQTLNIELNQLKELLKTILFGLLHCNAILFSVWCNFNDVKE